MYCKMLFVAVSLMLDTHPWWQLIGLCAPTTVILILVLLDKPYRCPDGNHGVMTSGDWQMVLAQVLQLLSYALVGLCLMNRQNRESSGEAGLSEGVKLFAALFGLAIVTVQLVALVMTLHRGGGTSSSEPEGVVMNVLAMDAGLEPELKAEPEPSPGTKAGPAAGQ